MNSFSSRIASHLLINSFTHSAAAGSPGHGAGVLHLRAGAVHGGAVSRGGGGGGGAPRAGGARKSVAVCVTECARDCVHAPGAWGGQGIGVEAECVEAIFNLGLCCRCDARATRRTHTCAQAHARTNERARARACARTHKHAHTRTRTRTHAHTHTHTHTQACRRNGPDLTHTHTHTHTHAHTHAHMHTHARTGQAVRARCVGHACALALCACARRRPTWHGCGPPLRACVRARQVHGAADKRVCVCAARLDKPCVCARARANENVRAFDSVGGWLAGRFRARLDQLVCASAILIACARGWVGAWQVHGAAGQTLCVCARVYVGAGL